MQRRVYSPSLIQKSFDKDISREKITTQTQPKEKTILDPIICATVVCAQEKDGALIAAPRQNLGVFTRQIWFNLARSDHLNHQHSIMITAR